MNSNFVIENSVCLSIQSSQLLMPVCKFLLRKSERLSSESTGKDTMINEHLPQTQGQVQENKNVL